MNVAQSELEEPPGCGRQPLPGARVSPQIGHCLSIVPETGSAQLFAPYISYTALWRPPSPPGGCTIDRIAPASQVTVSHGYLKLP